VLPRQAHGGVFANFVRPRTSKARVFPPLPKQLAPCGLHQPNAATNYTVTPVHQFHLTIILQRRVEPQYCTYRLQVYYRMELETFHCNFLKYTELHCITCGFRHLDAVWIAVPDFVHKRLLCEWLQYINLWQKGEGWFVMYRAGNWFFHSWLQTDTKIFTAVYIF